MEVPCVLPVEYLDVNEVGGVVRVGEDGNTVVMELGEWGLNVAIATVHVVLKLMSSESLL